MNKKELKQQKKKLFFELALLIPCIGYLSYKRKLSRSQPNPHPDGQLENNTDIILKTLKEKTIYYREFHIKSIAKNNSILQSIDTSNINTYLFAISLLANHIEEKEVIIDLKELEETLLDIQDEVIPLLNEDTVKRTLTTAERYQTALKYKLNFGVKK